MGGKRELTISAKKVACNTVGYHRQHPPTKKQSMFGRWHVNPGEGCQRASHSFPVALNTLVSSFFGVGQIFQTAGL